jgi:hypothetical protein
MANSYSRYKNGIYTLNRSNKKMLILRGRLDLSEDENDKFYRVDDQIKDRLDILSYKYYKTPDLWWVIAEANDINDPFSLEVGDLLRIPSLDKITKQLNRMG